MNKHLIALRGKKTIEQVCDDLRLNPNAYEAYESGEREPLLVVKKIIASYFGVKESEIWK